MQTELTREELIAEATDLAGLTMAQVVGVDPEDLTADDELLAALETLQGDGYTDETTGNVEAPCGYVYKIGRWTVETDNQGFKTVTDHGDELTAATHMRTVENEFMEWVSEV